MHEIPEWGGEEFVTLEQSAHEWSLRQSCDAIRLSYERGAQRHLYNQNM